MIGLGKRNLLGVLVDALDYKTAVEKIIDAAKLSRSYAVTALAVHGVMTGRLDRVHRFRLNHLDMVTPDGQPVRWALNLLYPVGLQDRVYGPTLMLRVCEAASMEGLSVFLYGATAATLERLEANLVERFPSLIIAGKEPSKFRSVTPEEKQALVDRIKASGARIVFVGLGCPRQEVFVYEFREALSTPVIAVGAAFDYHAGVRQEPPMWVQRRGLQWLYRLAQDPRRLWKRYLLYNTLYLALFALQLTRLWRPDPADADKPTSEVLYA